MKIKYLAFLPFLMLNGCFNKQDNDSLKRIIHLTNNAYAQGQYDATHGHLIIKMTNDSTMVFTENPWETKGMKDTAFARIFNTSWHGTYMVDGKHN